MTRAAPYPPGYPSGEMIPVNVKTTLWATVLLTAGILFACQSETKTEAPSAAASTATSTDAPAGKPAPAKTSGKTCQVKTMTMTMTRSMGGKAVNKTNAMDLAYGTNGKLATITPGEGSPTKDVMSFSYDSTGRITACEIPKSPDNQNKGAKAEYVYSSDGKLTEIKGSGMLTSRKFGHDDKGRITKQETFFNGQAFSTTTYEYNAAGAPVKAVILDRKGLPRTTFELSYDDKVNPLVDTCLLNMNDMMLGYPVGNHPHNVVARKVTQAQAPDKAEERVIKAEYNAAGYPTSMADGAPNGNSSHLALTYDCK